MNIRKKIKLSRLFPIAAVFVTLLLFKGLFLVGYVPSASMEPTIKEGSYILGLRAYGELKQGDIIIFRHEGQLLVKRVAAAGGAQVEHEGVALTVPEGCYYVLGDNAEHSMDSRYWEEPFVKQEDIIAKLIFP